MRRAIFASICLGISSVMLPATAATVASLQKEIAAGGKLTIIDVREVYEFRQGHIPGAINIPASLCPLKKLPPIGKVLVYDDGLGRLGTSTLSSAAAALAAKPGITVDTLQGGYAAWESANAVTTRGKGAKPETFNYITYQQLQAAAPADIVLVDMRKLTKPVLKHSSTLTDLKEAFPNRRVSPVVPKAEEGGPLIVLIDSADGSAEAAARQFKAGGARRYAILTGGELTLMRKGERGLERSGSHGGSTPMAQATLPPATTSP